MNAGRRSFRVLFTDLDGTLLDESTYSWKAAEPALGALREANVLVVFSTSKTFAEVERLQEQIGVEAPLIVENGGGIYFRPGQLEPTGLDVQLADGWHRVSLGVPHRALMAQLVAIHELTGIPIRSFSQMTPEEVAEDCGLPLEEARLAQRREFDEPFRLLSDRPEDLPQVIRLAEGVGLRVLQGGRYHHLAGRSTKGDAVRKVCSFLRKRRGPVRSVGLGDSPNDLPMLEAVDLPVVVMRHGGFHHPQLQEGVPHALLAPGVGPVGWNTAVLELLLDGRW